MRMLRLVGLAVFAALVVGCGSAAAPAVRDPVPTTCGGSTAWPPNGSAAAPSAITLAAIPPDGARVTNASDATWWYRASAWELGSCTGWISLEPAVLGSVVAGASADVRVQGPSDLSPFRVGLELWRCDIASCTGDPAGFAWVEAGSPLPSP